MKTALAILLTASVALAGDGREDVARKLETKISVDLRGVRLADAIEMFRQATGLTFVTADGGDRTVHLTARDLSARSALRLILAPLDLAAAYENGAVVIRSRRSLVGVTTLKIYDIRGATVKLQDFAGPRLDLRPATVGSFLC